MGRAQAKDKFREFMLVKGLKSTRQREAILDEFLRVGSHISTEELYMRLRRNNPQLGYATVHRTLKLFAECGIAEQRHFGDGQARYEASDLDEHNDHLICVTCGKILEFEDPAECTLLRARENRQTLTEYVLDFFQRSYIIHVVSPDNGDENGHQDAEGPKKRRQQLATNPLVRMTEEIFNGQVGDIRIGPNSR